MAAFDDAVRVVLKHEGGYVNHPEDPGGETKYGISKRSYPDLNIKALTKEDAIDIYRRDWWDKYGYGMLPDDIAIKVFDLAVNMGAGQAHQLLQIALNDCGTHLVIDGKLGAKTVAAVNTASPDSLMFHLLDRGEMYYRRLNKPQFLAGWLRRLYS